MNQLAPLDSPHLTGNPTAPTAGVADSSERIATTRFVKAAQAQQQVGNDPITLEGDASGSGTMTIKVVVTGLCGQALSANEPVDGDTLTWVAAARTWVPNNIVVENSSAIADLEARVAALEEQLSRNI